ncbi:hypothetical protein [Algoriphagus sp. AGSA1]|uniref:hypothetical protein n=1 Tax=Algoriphagus sp. AGSA1 TaxID=2907213 RepID=UPI001F1A1F66|nr:hypothetical protein [Algoriphagus sp. AGSA1]
MKNPLHFLAFYGCLIGCSMSCTQNEIKQNVNDKSGETVLIEFKDGILSDALIKNDKTIKQIRLIKEKIY